MITKAAIVSEKGAPFHIKEIQLDGPNVGEVLIRLVGSGICHTDLI